MSNTLPMVGFERVFGGWWSGCLVTALVMVTSACQPHTETARRSEQNVEERQSPDPPSSEKKQASKAKRREVFATAAEAFAALLRYEKTVEVIGFGEYHQTKGATDVPSSLERFTAEILPLLEGKASDLIFETWAASETCGEREREVVGDVQETTQRPNATENEVVAAIKTAQSIGIQPHILEMQCEDYEEVFQEGEVDYDMMLKVLTRLQRDKVREVRYARARRGTSWPAIVAVYGGNLHNDLYPELETASWTYGPELERSLGKRYVEVDLFVPEYIEGDKNLARQSWYPTFIDRQSSDHVLLLERGPSSYVMIFKRGEPSR